ncbi:hypothetical protein AZE42_07875 [Rhizopogon vesiculosus]|uniref:Uncharacterized protein n=1 Tax=Rhizopogon vesiculosus TaxID=180088 RepID=A0A1J8PVR6_9AGAM|nr:hypothetical protein AZE42_07875 [Rhizopogon vesiculosus]
MLEDALTDRDLVHRQTASVIAKHTALGVAGMGREDYLLHLMNLVWPNRFDTSPHCGPSMMRKLTPFSKPQRTSPICLETQKHHPYTVQFIYSLYDHLDLDSPLDASVFGCLATSFYCTARVGEFTVPTLSSFDPNVHVKLSNMCIEHDHNNLQKRVFHISRTKTFREGEDVFFAQQSGSSDPEQALLYHPRIHELPPGGAFADRFKNGHRPLTKQKSAG